MSLPNDDSSQFPLGQRLLKAGLLTQPQIAQGLHHQSQTNLKFGEICLKLGWVSPSELYGLINSASLCLGEVLHVHSFLSLTQLEGALQHQRWGMQKLGQILATKGSIPPEVINWALAEQRHLRQLAHPYAWEVLEAQLGESADLRERLGITAIAILTHKNGTTAKQNQLQKQELSTQSTAMMSQSDQAIGEPAQQIALLRHQLQAQEQEFDAYCEGINQQIEDYRSQYEDRIRYLEDELKQFKAKAAELEQEVERARAIEQEYEAMMLKQQQKLEGVQALLKEKIAELESLKTSPPPTHP